MGSSLQDDITLTKKWVVVSMMIEHHTKVGSGPQDDKAQRGGLWTPGDRTVKKRSSLPG